MARKIIILFVLVVSMSGCRGVAPKFKDSEAISAIEKFDGYVSLRYSSVYGEWTILAGADDVSIEAKGYTVGLAYENLLDKRRKLCQTIIVP